MSGKAHNEQITSGLAATADIPEGRFSIADRWQKTADALALTFRTRDRHPAEWCFGAIGRASSYVRVAFVKAARTTPNRPMFIPVLRHYGLDVMAPILVVGAVSMLRRAKLNPEKYPWVTRLLARRPFKVVAIALANKMARVAWALLAKGGTYRPRLAAA